jgi:hypothetical protein
MMSNFLKYGLFFFGLIWIFQCEAQVERINHEPVLKEDSINIETHSFFVLSRNPYASDEAIVELKVAKGGAKYNICGILLYSSTEIGNCGEN